MQSKAQIPLLRLVVTVKYGGIAKCCVVAKKRFLLPLNVLTLCKLITDTRIVSHVQDRNIRLQKQENSAIIM